MTITKVAVAFGYALFDGEQKVAVVSCYHDQNTVKNGRLQMFAQERKDWGIHFTSPQVSVELNEAIMAGLPTEAEVADAVERSNSGNPG